MIWNPLVGHSGLHFRVTQEFGENPQIYNQFGHEGHNGYDFAPFIRGMRGVVVYAPHEGYVQLGNQGNSGYGKYVRITSLPYHKEVNGRRRQSTLAHLESFSVEDGEFVYAGNPIGIMGSTGFSSGIHLHWTYKSLDVNKKVLNRNNGYNGALDIGKYSLPLLLRPLS